MIYNIGPIVRVFIRYIEALTKYATFTGRSRRKEYWGFSIFCSMPMFLMIFLDGMLGFIDNEIYVFTIIYPVAMVVPSISVGVRRMHDVGKSGWFLLVPFYNLILLLTNGNKGKNKYGEDPKSRLDYS